MGFFKKIFFTFLIYSILIGGDRIAVATKVIGSVEFVRGKDFAKSLKKGHIIESGDILKTKKGGFVAILFIDDKSALKIKENTELQLCNSAYEACVDTKAIIIGTEWNEFRALDFLKIRGSSKNLVIFDLRNIYNAKEITDLGFQYFGTGK